MNFWLAWIFFRRRARFIFSTASRLKYGYSQVYCIPSAPLASWCVAWLHCGCRNIDSNRGRSQFSIFFGQSVSHISWIAFSGYSICVTNFNDWMIDYGMLGKCTVGAGVTVNRSPTFGHGHTALGLCSRLICLPVPSWRRVKYLHVVSSYFMKIAKCIVNVAYDYSAPNSCFFVLQKASTDLPVLPLV